MEKLFNTLTALLLVAGLIWGLRALSGPRQNKEYREPEVSVLDMSDQPSLNDAEQFSRSPATPLTLQTRDDLPLSQGGQSSVGSDQQTPENTAVMLDDPLTKYAVNESKPLPTDNIVRYPNGTLLQIPDDSTIWYLDSQQRRPFRSQAEMASRDFSASDVVLVDAAVLAQYQLGPAMTIQSGTVVQDSSTGTIYLAQGGSLLPFADEAVFEEYGYNRSSLKSLAENEVSNYQVGNLIEDADTRFPDTKIRIPEDSTVYLLESDTDGLVKRPIPNPSVFASRGWQWEDILTIDNDELASYPTGDVLNYRDGSLVSGEQDSAVYVIENNMRRPIESDERFDELGYRRENILTLPATELNNLPLGAEL